MLRVALGGVLALVLAVPAATAEQGPPTPWDGVNPLDCVLQDAGTGATVKDPDADPFCIEFDKTHQNVTELGVVEFLSMEPARVAAASDKCFYFQSDHWRGSVVQDDGSTKTYEWDGHYFFDKARAEGGVWVTNFSVNGRTQDPTQLPGFPAEYAAFFGPGTGGVITHDEFDADPACIEKAAAAPPYAAPAPDEQGARCAAAQGDVGPGRLGGVTLGMSERRVWQRLGTPVRVKRGFLRFCLPGGTKLMVGVPGDRSGTEGGPGPGRATFLLTTSPALAYRGVARGATARRLREAFPHARAWFVLGHTRVVRLHRGVIAGIKDDHVRLLAVYDADRVRTAAAVRDWLRRSA